MTSATFIGVVFGAVVGLLLGVLPLVAGIKKNQPLLAFGGFFCCLIAGAFGGAILAIPAAALFWWLIKRAENKSKDFKD